MIREKCATIWCTQKKRKAGRRKYCAKCIYQMEKEKHREYNRNRRKKPFTL